MKPHLIRPNALSPRRRAVYYAGMATAILGFLSFCGGFLVGLLNIGNMGNFDAFAGGMRLMGLLAFGGIIAIFVGSALMGAGFAGAAGSGLLLDPERASRDLEPWARTSGRLTDAAFSEMHAVRETIAGLGSRDEPEPDEPVVKVRCRGCRSLNDETHEFCSQCGDPL